MILRIFKITIPAFPMITSLPQTAEDILLSALGLFMLVCVPAFIVLALKGRSNAKLVLPTLAGAAAVFVVAGGIVFPPALDHGATAVGILAIIAGAGTVGWRFLDLRRHK